MTRQLLFAAELDISMEMKDGREVNKFHEMMNQENLRATLVKDSFEHAWPVFKIEGEYEDLVRYLKVYFDSDNTDDFIMHITMTGLTKERKA
jgi:hypothetical protein